MYFNFYSTTLYIEKQFYLHHNNSACKMEGRNIFCLTRSNICNSSPTQYEKKLTSQTSSLTNRYENTDWKNSIYICMEFCQKFSNIENIYIVDSTIIIAKKQRTGEKMSAANGMSQKRLSFSKCNSKHRR